MTFEEELAKCKELIEARLYPAELDEPKLCGIHGVFSPEWSTDHNCLACNLVDSTDLIRDYFDRDHQYALVEREMPLLILVLYLFYERARLILDVAKVPETIVKRRFQAFRDVHKWANFLKHPGPFMLCHHPTYGMEDDDAKPDGSESVVIDQEFVLKHYSASRKDNELWKVLMNKKNVSVRYPNPSKLVERFLDDVDKLVALIQDNEMVVELLGEKSTYEKYFDELNNSSSDDSD